MDVEADLIDEAERFLEFAANYLLSSGKQIKPGETMAYGYWLVKFQGTEQENYLETWEYSADASTFVKGGDLTLGYWKDQHFVCDQQKAAFNPPRSLLK